MDDNLRLQYLQAMGIDVWLASSETTFITALLANKGITDIAEKEHGQLYPWLVLLDEMDITSDMDILMTDLLTAMGLMRDQVCILPASRERRIMQSIVDSQPKMIVVMGERAAHDVLQTTLAINDLRGVKQAVLVGGASVAVTVTLSLAHLMQMPLDKRLVWQDMQFALKMFNEPITQETK